MTAPPHANRPSTKRAILGCVGMGVITGIFFLTAPEIDLAVERLFVDETDSFFLARHPVPRFFNDLINNLAIALSVFALIGLVATWKKGHHFFDLFSRHYAFLTLSLLTGPGLIANALFKENWGRARPRQLTEFGGTQDFSPPFLISDQCVSNCSFVSGDASMAFALLAFALVTTKRRKMWISVSIAFGMFIGLIRMIQGAHFLSDVIFAGVFVILTTLILKLWLLDRWVAPEIPVAARWQVRFGFKDGPSTEPKAQNSAHAAQTEESPRGPIWRFFRATPDDLAKRKIGR